MKIKMKTIFTILFIISHRIVSFAQTDETPNARTIYNNSTLGAIAISVTIGGDFPWSGSYPATATERVDQFISRVINNGIVSNRTLTEVDKSNILSKIPMRGIILKRVDGSSRVLDLARFRLSGNLELNPYLKNDDILIFPAWNPERQIVSIYGAVNRPNRLQYIQGDKVSDILFFAQGFDSSYISLKRIEISRLNNYGSVEELITLNPTENIPVKMGDRIRFVAEDALRRDFKILVLGEVNYPGFISITRDKTTLYEVLQKAGGLKSTASLKFAKFLSSTSIAGQLNAAVNENLVSSDRRFHEAIDKVLLFDEPLNMMEMVRMSSLTTEDTIAFQVDNNLRKMLLGDMADISDLTDSTSFTSKIRVHDGDVLIIPRRPTNVYVFGQVNRIGNIPYSEGQGYQYYIENAAGLGEEATGEIYVIKGKSRAWKKVGTDPVTIEPGDFIWASKEIKRPFSYYLNLVSGVAGVIGSVATVVLLILQVGK